MYCLNIQHHASTPIGIYATLPFPKAAYPMLVSSAVHSMHSIAHRYIQGSPTNWYGVNLMWSLASCSSHLSAASWISVCVGSVGMTRFMRRAGRPSLPGRASTDTKVR